MPTTQTRLRRKLEAETRRNHILAAAERVFAAHAYELASMQQVAAQAGIGMRSLYEHFRSKQRLYETVMLLRLDDIHDRLVSAAERSDPLERLREMGTRYAAFFFEHVEAVPMFAMEKLAHDLGVGRRRKALDQRFTQIEAQVVRTLTEAGNAALIHTTDPTFLANVAIGIFTAVVRQFLLTPPPRDAGACADQAIELFLRGVSRAPAGLPGAQPRTAGVTP